MVGQQLDAVFNEVSGPFQQVLVFHLGDLVHVVDGGAGQDVVELVQEDGFPALVDLLSGVFHPQVPGPVGEEFRFLPHELRFPVAFFVPGHRGVGAPVVFQVQFADPAGEFFVFAAGFKQLVEIFPGSFPADLGRAGNALGKALRVFRHGPGGSAAAVAVAAGQEDVVCEFFLLVALPGPDDRGGVQVAVIGGVVAVLGLVGVLGGNQVSEHLAAVNALPPEGIHGQLVKLVPGDFCGHEVVDAGFFHNLGQGRRIAEHVRQPEDLVVLAEFFFEEPFAVEELAHHAFAGNQVAVGFQPHAAFHFPAAFGYPLFDAFKQVGITLFNEGVKLGLAGHEFVIGVLVHELQDGREGTGRFFPGLGNGPPPGHVNVGVADAGGNHLVVASQFRVDFLLHIFVGGVNGSVKFRAVRLPQVDEVDGFVQGFFQGNAAHVVLFQPADDLVGNGQVVIKPVDFRVPLHEGGFQLQIEVLAHMLVGVPAGISLQIQAVGFACLGAAGHQDFPVVDVNALDGLFVQKQQELGVYSVPVHPVGAEVKPQGFAVKAFRHGKLRPEPIMLVRAGPGVGFAVEGGIGDVRAVRFGGIHIKPLFIFKRVDGAVLDGNQAGQLIGNHINTLFCKNHRYASFLHKFRPCYKNAVWGKIENFSKIFFGILGKTTKTTGPHNQRGPMVLKHPYYRLFFFSQSRTSSTFVNAKPVTVSAQP